MSKKKIHINKNKRKSSYLRVGKLAIELQGQKVTGLVIVDVGNGGLHLVCGVGESNDSSISQHKLSTRKSCKL